MALIDIEYGSLASSETMNKNFMYLDDKIAETSESIMTSISSILSNIATINTRLADISDVVTNSLEDLSAKLEDYKNKTKILVSKSSIVPNWKRCSEIYLPANTEYTVSSNGFLLIKPANYSGDLIVNGVSVVFKTNSSVYDNSMQLVSIPVYKGDIVKSTATLDNAYFLPALEVTVENF